MITVLFASRILFTYSIASSSVEAFPASLAPAPTVGLIATAEAFSKAHLIAGKASSRLLANLVGIMGTPLFSKMDRYVLFVFHFITSYELKSFVLVSTFFENSKNSSRTGT